ncbi:shikimate dehydrogenase [Halobacteriales archaeon QS_8_69_26]|nr:MAG: shikimate dehydrogenase [Halobacteriales archaeon QS_8_69_26]
MDVYGLVGNPVGHSLSPAMHEAAYDALGVDARYVSFEPDRGDLAAAVAGARALGIEGINVTIPFKEEVLELDGIIPDDSAQQIGAANTLDLSGETVTAHNTDATGARRALIESGVTLQDATVTVVGAGGAGRAITVSLVRAGANVRVVNRTLDRAERLAEEAGERVSAYPLSDVPSLLGDSDVLVNATSVGMETESSPVPAEAVHGELTVFDAVYRPLQTRLLRDAQAAGAKTIDGARMLLYQGAAAFEIWTGHAAPVDEMERTLYDRL